MIRPRIGFLGVVLLSLILTSKPSQAYEEDTHFLMTYVFCRATGFTDSEALTIAAVDQGMDDSSGTVANGGTGGVIPNVPQEWMWHALDKDGKMGASGIVKRRDNLFGIALSRSTPQEKLQYLGMFFHFQQDTWAHRHHYDGNTHSNDSYTSYNTPFGHALDGHQPDRPPFDPLCAFLCLQNSIQYAQRFLKDGLGRQPNALFANYQPFTGAFQDDGWNDKRKGKYFHMLGYHANNATPAQAFLCELIRAQCNAYSSSSDANPRFFLRDTADELNFDKARAALQSVCTSRAQAIGYTITVPSKQDKLNQHFTNLTSNSFPAAIPQ